MSTLDVTLLSRGPAFVTHRHGYHSFRQLLKDYLILYWTNRYPHWRWIQKWFTLRTITTTTMALCPGQPNWAGTRKKHPPTHTYPNYQSSFICFLHLLWSI